MRFAILALAFALAACSKPAPGHVRFKLERESAVSLGLFDAAGQLVAQPVAGRVYRQGAHVVDCTDEGEILPTAQDAFVHVCTIDEARKFAPPGTWTWRAVAYPVPTPQLVGALAAGVAEKPGDIAGGDAGPPCAVAADENAVFLGWRGATDRGHEIVALDPAGKVLWGYHRGPGTTGVTALAADGGFVFVLDHEILYKLDAKTGQRVPFGDQPEIILAKLWPADARVKPQGADALAADNGRVYLTFGADSFIAALEATSGAYVITLSGPQLGQLALSQTPMRDPQTGVERPIDFGVAAIAGNGLAYFLMEHEPAWVMGSITRWLQPDEKIAALTTRGDTMKTGNVTIYTALGAPHHQVQLRPAEAAEGFSIAVGKPGGRPALGPWESGALRDIRALAVDALGQLWIAEGDEKFGRFSVWKTEGKEGVLVREIFGPISSLSFAPDLADPHVFTLAGHRWKLDPATGRAVPTEIVSGTEQARWAAPGALDDHGLCLWNTPPGSALGLAAFRSRDGRYWGHTESIHGTHVFALPGLEAARVIGSGQVTIPAAGN